MANDLRDVRRAVAAYYASLPLPAPVTLCEFRVGFNFELRYALHETASGTCVHGIANITEDGEISWLEGFDPYPEQNTRAGNDAAAALAYERGATHIKSLWFDYTHQTWVENGVYATCGHDLSRPCWTNRTTGASGNCYGRDHAGETPTADMVQRYDPTATTSHKEGDQ